MSILGEPHHLLPSRHQRPQQLRHTRQTKMTSSTLTRRPPDFANGVISPILAGLAMNRGTQAPYTPTDVPHGKKREELTQPVPLRHQHTDAYDGPRLYRHCRDPGSDPNKNLAAPDTSTSERGRISVGANACAFPFIPLLIAG